MFPAPRILSALLLAVAGTGSSALVAAPSGDFPCTVSANEPLLDQAERFILAELRLQPVEATQAGYHGDAQTPLDTRLDDLSPARSPPSVPYM